MSEPAIAVADPVNGPRRAPADERQRRWLPWAVRVALALATLALYWGSIGTNFVGDDWYFLALAHDHPLLWNLTPLGGYHYNPVLGAIFFVTYHLFSLDPVPYHLLAYAVFWLAAVLVMQLGWKLTGRLSVGALAGCLYVAFGSQYEAAIWGVVAYAPGVSTVLYLAGLLLFIAALNPRLTRGRRRAAYAGFLIALVLGPFVYEQNITLIGACMLYRAFVVEAGEPFTAAALRRRARVWLASFALPAIFFVGYLGLKVWLAHHTTVSQLPGLAEGWWAFTLFLTVGFMEAFVPGAPISGLYTASLIWITPLGYLLDAFIELLLFVTLFIKLRPVPRFLLLFTAMQVLAQIAGLGNIVSRHLFLISAPTTILWAMLLISLPGWLRIWLARRGGAGSKWLTAAPSIALTLFLVTAGARFALREQRYWQATVRHVDRLMAQVRSLSATDPGATTLYLIDAPDSVIAPTGETMYEFRNSARALVELTMPGRFASTVVARTDDDNPVIRGYTVLATSDQIARWSQDAQALVLKYDPATGDFTRLTPSRAQGSQPRVAVALADGPALASSVAYWRPTARPNGA